MISLPPPALAKAVGNCFTSAVACVPHRSSPVRYSVARRHAHWRPNRPQVPDCAGWLGPKRARRPAAPSGARLAAVYRSTAPRHHRAFYACPLLTSFIKTRKAITLKSAITIPALEVSRDRKGAVSSPLPYSRGSSPTLLARQLWFFSPGEKESG